MPCTHLYMCEWGQTASEMSCIYKGPYRASATHCWAVFISQRVPTEHQRHTVELYLYRNGSLHSTSDTLLSCIYIATDPYLVPATHCWDVFISQRVPTEHLQHTVELYLYRNTSLPSTSDTLLSCIYIAMGPYLVPVTHCWAVFISQ